MIIISHRGNIEGREPYLENSPKAIEHALSLGFHVEIDVWIVSGNAYLGHEYPMHLIDKNFLCGSGLLCHAKNLEALTILQKLGIHHFWHDKDDYTFTSQGIPVVHCGQTPLLGSIWIEPGLNHNSISGLHAICTDYPASLQQSLTK